MNRSKLTRIELRARRHACVRAKVNGTSERPRLAVHKSLTSMYAQIIDDSQKKTLVGLHSKNHGKDGDAGERKGKVATSFLLGLAIAKKAKEAGVSTVVFDRGGYPYHGRVKAFAEGAREGGLIF